MFRRRDSRIQWGVAVSGGVFAFLAACTHVSSERGPQPPSSAASETSERKVEGVTIDFWTRTPGAHAFIENPERTAEKTIVVPLTQAEHLGLVDHQYGVPVDVKGIPLYDLLGRYDAPAYLDLALLHFENGVVIPVPRRRGVDGMPKALLAVRIRNKRKQWTSIFPSARRPGLSTGDKLPLLFRENKIVVDSISHPYVPKAQQEYFSPWLHADSLVGVELVTFKGYYGQFDLAETEAERAGYNAFMVRCQFCHGAQSVGAKLGWDFVTPLKLYTRRNAKSLYYHTKFEPRDAAEKGRRMPVQADLSPAEAIGIWAYMEKLADEDLRPYAP